MTTFLDLTVMLFWPLVLLAAVWVIAIKALAERDEISDVVEALTGPDDGEEDVNLGTAVLLRRDSTEIEGGDGSWFQIHFRRTRGTARATKKTRFRNDVRRGGRVSVAGVSHGRGLSEYTSPVTGPASLRTALIVLLAADLIVTATPIAHAGRFVFDQRRTEVRFAYTMAYSTQRGRFTKVSGTLDYDEAAPEKSKIHASIAAASLTTGEALVDNELKGESFFNVEASPVITFKSLGVRSDSPTAAEVLGEVTVNGITKPVTFEVSIKPHDDPALKYDAGARKFIATTRIQRSAFNMTDYQSMVGDDVDIEINAIVRPRK